MAGCQMFSSRRPVSNSTLGLVIGPALLQSCFPRRASTNSKSNRWINRRPCHGTPPANAVVLPTGADAEESSVNGTTTSSSVIGQNSSARFEISLIAWDRAKSSFCAAPRIQAQVVCCKQKATCARCSHSSSTATGVSLRTNLVVRYKTNKSSNWPTMGIKVGMSWIGLNT